MGDAPPGIEPGRNEAERAGSARVGYDKAFAFNGFEMAGGGAVAAKAEVRGDFAQGRVGTVGEGFGLDEIQHPLLGWGEVLHILYIWIVYGRQFVNGRLRL